MSATMLNISEDESVYIIDYNSRAPWYPSWRLSKQIEEELKDNVIIPLYVPGENRKSMAKSIENTRHRKNIYIRGKWVPFANGSYIFLLSRPRNEGNMEYYKNIYKYAIFSSFGLKLIYHRFRMKSNLRGFTDWLYKLKDPNTRMSDACRSKPFGGKYNGRRGNNSNKKTLRQYYIYKKDTEELKLLAIQPNTVKLPTVMYLNEREAIDALEMAGFDVVPR